MKKLLLLCLPFAISAFGADANDLKRLNAAADMFSEVMGTADKAIPQELLDKSQCAIVVPGLKKGAFILGGKYGRGIASCR